MLIPASAPDADPLGRLGWLWLSDSRRPGPPRLGCRIDTASVIRVLALFVAVYGAFLAVSISFFDANTPLDDRILLPVFAAGLIVLLHLLDVVWPSVRRRPAVAYLMVTLIVGFVTAHLAKGVEAISASYAGGWGLSSLAWQQSGTLAQVRKLPEAC